MKKTAEEWAAEWRAKWNSMTPEEQAADIEAGRRWCASLPVLPPIPQRPGEVLAIFIKRSAEADAPAAKGDS